jgi:hypothetical protein
LVCVAKAIVPPRIWGDGDPEGVRQRAAEEMKDTARAAARLGVNTVVGFTGSKIWKTVAMFPPVPTSMTTTVTRTSPTGGTRFSMFLTRSEFGSLMKCIRRRSPMTTGRLSGRWRRSGTGKPSG